MYKYYYIRINRVNYKICLFICLLIEIFLIFYFDENEKKEKDYVKYLIYKIIWVYIFLILEFFRILKIYREYIKN